MSAAIPSMRCFLHSLDCKTMPSSPELFLAALPKLKENSTIPTLDFPSVEDSKLYRWLVHELIESPVGFTDLGLISALPPTDGMAILESLTANPSFFDGRQSRLAGANVRRPVATDGGVARCAFYLTGKSVRVLKRLRIEKMNMALLPLFLVMVSHSSLHIRAKEGRGAAF
jgi:hypothetical protein